MMTKKMRTFQIEFFKKLLFGVIKTRLSVQKRMMNNNYNKYLTVGRLACKIQGCLKI